MSKKLVWYKVLDNKNELSEGRVMTVTASQKQIAIKHILINNSELGKISKEQRTSELDVWQTSLHNPNFADFANNCGALGIRVGRREDLEMAMQKIADHNGPALLEVICDVTLI